MSRRKSTVVSLEPIRRSARLISKQNRDSRGKPGKDLVFNSEPLNKTRREVLRELSKRLDYSLDNPIEDSSSKKSHGLNVSEDGFPSLRRSLRLISRGYSDLSKDKPFTKPASSSSSRMKSLPNNVSPSSVLRRSPRFSCCGGGSVYQSSSSSFNRRKSSGNSVLSKCSTKSISSESGKNGNGIKSRDRRRSRLHPKSNGCDDNDEEDKEVSVCLNERKRMTIANSNEEENDVPKADEVKRKGKEKEEDGEEEGLKTKKKRSRMKSSPNNVSPSSVLRRSPRFSSFGGGSVYQSSSSSSNRRKLSGNSVLSRCSTKSISSESGKNGDGIKSRDRSRSRLHPKSNGCDDNDDGDKEVSICLNPKSNGIKSRDKSRSRLHPKSNGCDDNVDGDKEVTICPNERKRMRIANSNEEENDVPTADEVKRKGKEEEEDGEEEGLKTKKKLQKGGWTEELELALQGAYLTVKPCPNFWKKVAKMVPGKTAQECFDRVNSALITPRQAQPRRARKTNLSPIPQFSLSASKLLKPSPPKTKIRRHRNNFSKKTVRHLLEKQNHMDQGLGFDLFSVLEPSITSNFLSTPVEKGKSLPKIIESPLPCSSKDQTTLVSPPVLKQVKNKALHEKYIDHLHVREAKRKANSSRLARKENIRPVEIQKKDTVRAAKDALLFDVQDAIQKLKGLEAENSSSSSEFCYSNRETDEEDEGI